MIKKPAVLSMLFLTAFVFTIGISLALYDNSQAGGGNCKTVCVYELVCSIDTGPYCTDPAYPFYVYEMNPYCLGYPDLFCPENVNPPPVGCCHP